MILMSGREEQSVNVFKENEGKVFWQYTGSLEPCGQNIVAYMQKYNETQVLVDTVE